MESCESTALFTVKLFARVRSASGEFSQIPDGFLRGWLAEKTGAISQTMSVRENQTAPELAEILAAGLMRLRARKSSQTLPHTGERSLDFSPDQSGHAPGIRERTA